MTKSTGKRELDKLSSSVAITNDRESSVTKKGRHENESQSSFATCSTVMIDDDSSVSDKSVDSLLTLNTTLTKGGTHNVEEEKKEEKQEEELFVNDVEDEELDVSILHSVVGNNFIIGETQLDGLFEHASCKNCAIANCKITKGSGIKMRTVGLATFLQLAYVHILSMT